MQFKSLIQLMDHFKDEETCIEYYKGLRWGGKPFCPHCQTEHPYVTKRGYRCRNKDCKKCFNVKSKTIFENTKISLRYWFAALYLFNSSKKGISSLQLSRQLNITQKSAWFMLHRIRESFKEKNPQMLGARETVECDETHIGGKERNKHYKKKRSRENPDLTNEGKEYKPKKVVLGMIERNGKVILKHVASTGITDLIPQIGANIIYGARVYTDENPTYNQLGTGYYHATINHSFKKYVDGDVHTNTIENFWSNLKRGVNGTYHHISEKHIDRYLNEFSGRYNTRHLNSDFCFEKCLAQSDSRLSYKQLTGTC